MDSDCMRSRAAAMPTPSSAFVAAAAAVVFFFSLTPSLSDEKISEAGLSCGNSSSSAAAAAPSLVPSFVRDMESLSQLMTTRHFATRVTNSSPGAAIYGLSQCRRDLSQTDCLLCFAASRTKLPRCLPSPAARIYFDGCFLRYDRYDFFAEAVDPVYDSTNCSSDRGAVGEPAGEGFAAAVGSAVGNATRAAASGGGGGFGVAEAGGVYALAQCWESISTEGCRVCLEKAEMGVRKCVPSGDGRGLNAGCYLRYSTVKFYSDGGASEADHGSSSTGITVAVVLVAAACIMLSVFAAYACYARVLKLKGDNIHLRKISIGSSLNFKYETLEKATNYFDHLKKLGQGGAGSVYKGTLPGGKVVAVKRLIFNTRQWVDEFFNEVNLISGIEHKNLVKLLGCSIEGPESLLVYEYVPNKSIDDYISDRNKIQILNWKQRMNIIAGTAEGIAYLHGGCKERIIHRDIKGSNILLDENLTPKIADFGLARCFGPDKTHLSTGIAGTLGYMAPEYLVRGQLTEKADVYSFGVLVLEIICGRRSSSFREEPVSLLQMVWNFYKSDNLVGAVDSCLNGDFPAQEAWNVLQIGLLCTQASAAARPSMVEVVQMLTCENVAIPEPTQPPFLNANASGPASSNRSSSMSSFVSRAARKINASYTSSESSSMRSANKRSSSHEVLEK
ncbi:cysteine-rich receptor-like protein kinase 42 [Syzygium oleosum]|uniref:cysteine-rich receptor-like protein kinase 42 n=1 Tax=Syzygium oleosum TaxID=219896 RepID=UPI0024BBC8CE|nr:cysteine-rich receptor-like protein kinase 42 [Syzygium oleosum]